MLVFVLSDVVIWYRIVLLTMQSNVNVLFPKGICTNVFEMFFCVLYVTKSTLGCFAIESTRQCRYAVDIGELGIAY